MQYHLPASRDRAFTELGIKNFVNVDISIAEDTLGFDSKLPCNDSINESFDDCAYDQESVGGTNVDRKIVLLYLHWEVQHLKQSLYLTYVLVLPAAERNYAVKAWLHSSVDARPNNMHS